MENEIISKQLLTFDYYFQKVPLYLRNDDNFMTHFKIWCEALIGNVAIDNKFQENGVAPSVDILLTLVDIFANDYLQNVQQLVDASTTNFEFLDLLGLLFGVYRNFSINDNNVSLNNEDLLLLIKAQIVRNYHNGSMKQTNEYYQKVSSQLITSTDPENVAHEIVYWNANVSDVSDNKKLLFYNGLLTIEHLGISQTLAIFPITDVMFWADENGQNGSKTWDEGVWAI